MWNQLSTLLTDVEVISIAAIASAISIWLGGNESLLILIQYLFFIDALLICFIGDKELLARCWDAVKKYMSVYLSVILVGIGTKAFDVAIHSHLQLKYSGTLFFNLFIYTLVIYEIICINVHLSKLGFTVNKNIEILFKAVLKKLFKKADLQISDKDIDKLTGQEEIIKKE